MHCVDVNVLVYALRSDSEGHDAYRERLTILANGDEPLGVPDAVLSGYVRVVTNRRIFKEPTDPRDAWRDVESLIGAPAATRVRAGERHWDIFRTLCDEIGARGPDISDAFLAAVAIEQNATWLSADRGFARFPRLRWRHPLDD